MQTAILEHINITVTDPDKTAKFLCDVFGWHIRWKGPSIHNGRSIHVGTKGQYIALYSQGTAETPQHASYERRGGLNHIALVVDDLDATEAGVIEAGYNTHNHANYEPGRRFYFHDYDGIEFEIVSYKKVKTATPKTYMNMLGLIAVAGAFLK